MPPDRTGARPDPAWPYPLPKPTRGRPRDWKLARHQTDTLDGLVCGATNAEMAAHLYLAQDSVKSRVRVLMDKAGHRSRHGLVTWAYVQGLYVPDLHHRLEHLEDGMTTQRYRVLAEVVTGCSREEVAARLAVTEDTVATHLRHLSERWRVSGGMPVLTSLAIRSGFVDPSELVIV